VGAHGEPSGVYLPSRRAWRALARGAERTQEVKRAASHEGRQHAANPEPARAARAAAEVGAMTAKEAVRAARGLSPDAARRALHHERATKDRKTVVRALERVAGG
jgi:hypothetical protein